MYIFTKIERKRFVNEIMQSTNILWFWNMFSFGDTTFVD